MQGEREGAGPDGDPMLSPLRDRSRADGEVKGRVEDLGEAVRGIRADVALPGRSVMRVNAVLSRPGGGPWANARPSFARRVSRVAGGKIHGRERRGSVRGDATWGSPGVQTGLEIATWVPHTSDRTP